VLVGVVGLVALVAARRRMGDIAARATGTRVVTNRPAGSGTDTDRGSPE
jgi:hypothetical protein